MKRASLVVVALLLAAAASCSDDEPGVPIPQTPAASSTTTGTPAATSRPPSSRLLPPRPVDLDLTSLDSCAALTTTQEKQLDYDLGWQRPPRSGVDPASGGPNCTFGSSHRGLGSTIAFVTTDGVELWLTGRLRSVASEKAVVSGFPILQMTTSPDGPLPDECDVVVDVHDGQYLEVFSSRSPGGRVTGSAPYCTEARNVAAMVLENLQNR